MSAPDIAQVFHRRPGWVSAISLFVFFANLLALLNLAVPSKGTAPASVPEQYRAAIQQLQAPRSGWDLLLGVSVFVLNIVAATQLFFLRRRAYNLFATALLLSVAWFVVQSTTGPLAAVLRLSRGAFLLVALFVAAATALYAVICVYAWQLREDGVLK